MAIIRFSGFLGENRAVHPILIPDTVCTVSNNQKPGRGDLRPWGAPLNNATVPSGRTTIHRMGRDVASDANYWLSWPTVVHVVVAPNAADTLERTYYSGGASFAPRWTNTTMALATPPYPTSYRELGVPAPASACTVSASGGTSTIIETRFYTYTYVTDIGEESAPAAPSLELTCKIDDTISLSGLGTSAPAGAYGIISKRVYRTQSGSNSSDFYLCSESDVPIGTATFSDTGYLGEVMPTTTWLMPPTNLSWLTGLWNGMMAGISGRSVRFCESYTFYAWPIAYEILPTNAQPVALATFGQTLVMLTNGNPSLITGGTPDAMDEQPMEFYQACIAPASAVGVGHGVVWASPDGLCYVGSGGARLLTEGVMTRDDWQAINPSSIQGAVYERRYFGFYTVGGVRKGFIYDFSNPQGMYFLDFGCDALHMDDLQDVLFILDGGNVKKWDAGSALTVTAKSKSYKMPKPIQAFSCAEVVADTYPVTFKLYADDTLKHTQTVTANEPFRLPGGYYFQSCQVEVSGAYAVQGVAVAHSMEELSQV